jgi:4-carboxymuconolactone decarboxylase
MPRLQPLTERDELPAEAHEAFDAIVASRGSMPGPFAVMMHGPEVANRVAHLGAYLRFESSLSPVHQELAILTATREFDCAPEWGGHVMLARRAGVSDDTIQAIATMGELDALPEDDAVIVRFGRELLRDHEVSDDAYAAALAMYGASGVIDLSATLGYYALMSTVLNAVGLEAREGAEPLPPR